MAFCLKIPNHLYFLLGKDLGVNFIDTELFRNGFGCCAVVAGQHDDLYPVIMKHADRFASGWLDGISDTQQSGDSSVNDDIHNRLAVSSQLFRLVR